MKELTSHFRMLIIYQNWIFSNERTKILLCLIWYYYQVYLNLGQDRLVGKVLYSRLKGCEVESWQE